MPIEAIQICHSREEEEEKQERLDVL